MWNLSYASMRTEEGEGEGERGVWERGGERGREEGGEGEEEGREGGEADIASYTLYN